MCFLRFHLVGVVLVNEMSACPSVHEGFENSYWYRQFPSLNRSIYVHHESSRNARPATLLYPFSPGVLETGQFICCHLDGVCFFTFICTLGNWAACKKQLVKHKMINGLNFFLHPLFSTSNGYKCNSQKKKESIKIVF